MPDAFVRRVGGQLELVDPTAQGVARAVEQANKNAACGELFMLNKDRIKHFIERVRVTGRTHKDVVIVILNVDDQYGGPLADALMPGHNWQVYRDRGETPVARGLAGREGIEEAVTRINKGTGQALHHMNELAVVVVTASTAAVYYARQAEEI